MVLLLINIAYVVAWVAWLRWKPEDNNRKAGGAFMLFIVGLPVLAADTSFQYKEIRRDPAKMLQLEWDGAKYEGYGPKALKKVESFTPAPHTRPVYANFFGFEIENNAIEK